MLKFIKHKWCNAKHLPDSKNVLYSVTWLARIQQKLFMKYTFKFGWYVLPHAVTRLPWFGPFCILYQFSIWCSLLLDVLTSRNKLYWIFRFISFYRNGYPINGKKKDHRIMIANILNINNCLLYMYEIIIINKFDCY